MKILKQFKSIFNLYREPKKLNLENLSGVGFAKASFLNLVIEQKIPGASVTILKKGLPIIKSGFGYSDVIQKSPINPEQTLFRTASISKCITALALGKMVEDKILDWEDSFYKHVPYFPEKKFDFTLRQLASHTAGIRGYRGKEFALNQPFSIKDSLTIFQNDPLQFEPGTGYLYNSFDFVLLSLAIQEAAQMPFEDYVYHKVLKPLQMYHTIPEIKGLKDTEIPKLSGAKNGAVPLKFDASPSQNYTKRLSGFLPASPVNNFYKLAGGGYLSTSNDIAKMGQAILDQKLLKESTYNELLTAQIINKKSTYYGLGFQVSQDAQGRPYIGHVGSNVGAYTNFFVYPKEQLVVVILIHCTDPNCQEDLNRIVSQLISSPS